jgi:hypothetical protein
MTIRDAELFMRSLWDWSTLDGCFGNSKIRVGDIDGFVERRGRVLFIETKYPGSRVPRGQMRAYRALVALGCTVLIAWGLSGEPQRLRIMTPASDTTIDPANIGVMRTLVRQWYEWADRS